MVELRAFVGKFVYALARTFHDFFGMRASCRYSPTCSQYAREAITRHGILKGGGMAMRRVLRCRPGASWGPDPVPAS